MTCQTTIARPVETSGIGLHTAVPGRLRLLPAPAGTGIVFRRTDLDDFLIEARAANVAKVSYATSLMKKGVLISTTEHLLAALYASGIDNVFVELDALEVPILDGSSQPFMELVAEAGVRRLRRLRRYIRLLRPVEVAEDGRRIGIYPADDFSVSCFVEFPHPRIGAQQVELRVDGDTFARELAPARTFGFMEDVERLRAVGLIRGGSLENAIVLTREGILNDGLRFPDEFVRHKALDLIGDLALVGRPLLGRVEAHKAGHALHVALVSRLLADPSAWELTTKPAQTTRGVRRRASRASIRALSAAH